MTTRIHFASACAIALTLSAMALAPHVARAKTYTMHAEYALDSAGGVTTVETSTVHNDHAGTGVQVRYWTFPHNGFAALEVVGVFTPGGALYHRVETTGAAGTCRIEQNSNGTRISVWDSGSVVNVTHILRYYLPGAVKRYYNAAAFDWWIFGTYDAPASLSSRVVPPRPLGPETIRARAWDTHEVTVSVGASGVVECSLSELPANTPVWSRTFYAPEEFADAQLTIGTPGLVRSPSSSRLVRRRRGGSATYKLSATVTDCIGDPLGKARVYLQTSKSGRSGWKNTYPLRTSTAGSASRSIRAKRVGTRYYRWYVPARAGAYHAAVTSKQAVVIR